MIQRVAFVDKDGVASKHRRAMILDFARLLGKPNNPEFLDHFYQSTKSLDDSELIHAFCNQHGNFEHLLNSDSQDSFAATAEAYPLAKEAFQLLKENNFTVFIVTARAEKMRPATLEWLEKHGMLQFIDAVYMRHDVKDRPAEFKAEMAVKLNATHIFEDTFDNMRSIVKKCPALHKAYLINRPWNGKHAIDELYPSFNTPIERMDSFHDAVLDAISTVKK